MRRLIPFAAVFLLLLTFLHPIKAQAYCTSVSQKAFHTTVKVRGAADITVQCSRSAKICVYRKKILSKVLIARKTSAKSLNITTRRSGSNAYYITVSTRDNKKSRIYCNVTQHQDKKSSSSGGVWTPVKSSPVPNSSVIYLKKYFFTKSHCKQALKYVKSARYLDYQSKLVNGTLTIAGLIAGGSGIKALEVGSAFLSIGQIGWSANFKKSTINQLKRKGNYNSVSGTFRNGVILTEYMSGGMTMLEVSSWFNRTMLGASGYIGKWSTK